MDILLFTPAYNEKRQCTQLHFQFVSFFHHLALFLYIPLNDCSMCTRHEMHIYASVHFVKGSLPQKTHISFPLFAHITVNIDDRLDHITN